MRKERSSTGKDYSYSKLIEQDKQAPGEERSRAEPKERCTFYIYPDQTIRIEELILKLRQADPALKLDKSGIVRVALDLLSQLMETTDLKRLLPMFAGGDLEEALPRLLLSELARRQS